MSHVNSRRSRRLVQTPRGAALVATSGVSGHRRSPRGDVGGSRVSRLARSSSTSIEIIGAKPSAGRRAGVDLARGAVGFDQRSVEAPCQ